MEAIGDIITAGSIDAAAGEQKPRPQGDCPICGGSGFILQADGTAKHCVCYAERRLLAAQKRAGLQPMLRRMSFANFDLACYAPGIQAPAGRGQTYYELAKAAKTKTEELCLAVCRGEQPRGLLLLGQVGSGKTHLAAAAANRLLQKGRSVLFIVVPDLLDELKSGFGGDETTGQDLLRRAKRVEVLVLDDLGTHNMSDWTRGVLFAILNFRLNEGLTTIATSNFDETALKEALGLRSFSRLVALCEPCKLPCDRDLRLRGLEKK